MELRTDQVRRYARHILLPDVGGVGQERLLAAVVRVDDAGGAGAVAILYLAAAGVGRLELADGGVVRAEDVGFLYETGDVGCSRVDAARARVAALNPDVTVVAGSLGVPLAVGTANDAVEALALGASAAAALVMTLAQGAPS